MTELERYTTPQPMAVAAVPTAAEFNLIMQQADIISRSGIVPNNYRSTFSAPDDDGYSRPLQDRRPNVVVATLTGRTFGWDALTAMRNIHIIEGAASLKPEAQLGMIRARGHHVKITRFADHVNVYAKRADTGDDLAATFSFADAVRADLCALGEDGMPRARSEKGKKLPWEQYPVDMCQWRAVSIIARGLFGDIVLGLGYTPEELGAIVDAEGEVVIESAPMPTPVPEPVPAAPAPAETPVAEGTVMDTPTEPQTPPPTPPQARPGPQDAEGHREQLKARAARQVRDQAMEETAAKLAEHRGEVQTAQQDPWGRTPEQIAAEERHVTEVQTALKEGPMSIPTQLDIDLDHARKTREARNAARSGPAINVAKASAFDQVHAVYPDWTKDECVQEIRDELAKLNPPTNVNDATAADYDRLRQKWETQQDDAIRRRHAQAARKSGGHGVEPPY